MHVTYYGSYCVCWVGFGNLSRISDFGKSIFFLLKLISWRFRFAYIRKWRLLFVIEQQEVLNCEVKLNNDGLF